MAKIYDAMRRAEEERQRVAGVDAPAPAAPPVPWDEPVGEAPAPPESDPFWKRWLSPRSNALADTANDVGGSFTGVSGISVAGQNAGQASAIQQSVNVQSNIGNAGDASN